MFTFFSSREIFLCHVNGLFVLICTIYSLSASFKFFSLFFSSKGFLRPMNRFLVSVCTVYSSLPKSLLFHFLSFPLCACLQHSFISHKFPIPKFLLSSLLTKVFYFLLPTNGLFVLIYAIVAIHSSPKSFLFITFFSSPEGFLRHENDVFVPVCIVHSSLISFLLQIISFVFFSFP
jgi:hypothetical protein